MYSVDFTYVLCTKFVTVNGTNWRTRTYRQSWLKEQNALNI